MKLVRENSNFERGTRMVESGEEQLNCKLTTQDLLFISLLLDFRVFEKVVLYNTICSNTDFLSTVSFYK